MQELKIIIIIHFNNFNNNYMVYIRKLFVFMFLNVIVVVLFFVVCRLCERKVARTSSLGRCRSSVGKRGTGPVVCVQQCVWRHSSC